MAKRQQERYKPEQVIEALRKCCGIPARAATMLDCDRQTVLNYCKKYPKVQAARTALDAGYVAVILDRFLRHTGIKPELLT